MAAQPQLARSVLSSWKEIAQYLGKGVRTVQRWERQMSLPVHRPPGSNKGVVLAYTDELDRWAHSDQGVEARQSPDVDVRVAVKQHVSESNFLRERCHELRNQHHAAVTMLVTNLSSMVQLLSDARRIANDFPALAIEPRQPDHSRR